MDLSRGDRGVRIKLPITEGSESNEGSTEGKEYLKQNMNVRNYIISYITIINCIIILQILTISSLNG